MKQINKFQKGSGVYVCRVCGKKTRATGYSTSAADVELCNACYESAGAENHHSDNGHIGSPIGCNLCKQELGYAATS